MKRVFATLALCIAMMAFAGLAYADEVTVDGSTLGRFNGSGSFVGSVSLSGLTFTGSIFGDSACAGCGTTAGGVLGIGGVPNVLGSFSLSNTAHNYNGNTFTLQVTFTLPGGVTSANPTQYSATLTGRVTSVPAGGVVINFDNTPVTFTFSNPDASGTFTFNVNDLSVTHGHTAYITGSIFNASQGVPEPASMVLLGSGLLSAGTFLRRKLHA